MRKLILTVVGFATSFAINTSAQSPSTTESDSVVVSATELNALRSDVNTMKSELEEIEKKEKKDAIWKHRRAWTFAYTNSTLTQPDDESWGELKSKFGVGMTFSNTYFLHKPAILGMIKIGIDAKWLDINYVQYEKEPFSKVGENGSEIVELERKKAEIGMGLGPSVTVAPLSWMPNALRYLRATAYYHFTPSVSAMYLDDESSVAFNMIMNVGAKVTYRRLSVGIEHRWGTAKYDRILPDEYFEETGKDSSDKTKYKTKSIRAYISLNF